MKILPDMPIKPSRLLLPRRPQTVQASVPRSARGALIEVEPVGVGEDVEDHVILYVTNGLAYARIDLGPDHGAVAGPVPAEALRHLEKGESFTLGEDQVRVGITTYDRVWYAYPSRNQPQSGPTDTAQFPKWSALLKRWGLRRRVQGADLLALHIDPKLLAAAAAAIGESVVKIELDLRHARAYAGKKSRWYGGPLRIVPHIARKRDAEAYLMPLRPRGEDY